MNKAMLLILFLLVHIPILSQVDYKTQIEPIFYDKCSGCHTGGGSSGGQDLSSYSGLIAGGNSGSTIIPGDSQNSLLWKRINDGSMPPGSNDVSLSKIDLVAKWINEGALENITTQNHPPENLNFCFCFYIFNVFRWHVKANSTNLPNTGNKLKAFPRLPKTLQNSKVHVF